MRRKIRRAELCRPPSGQRLALVAAGEEGELLRVGVANIVEPRARDLHRLVPLDLYEFARAALADPLQWLAQPGGRIMLHDAGRAFAAQHALVDGMVPVAFDVADLAVADMHLDAAAARAHVAGGVFDLVGYYRREVDYRLPEHSPSLSGAPSAGVSRVYSMGIL